MLSAAMVKLTLRIDLSDSTGLGPGKVRLLEHIAETGSISAAGRAMNMSYRRAWLLVDEPVAVKAHGGKAGGGAALTEFGHRLIQRYRDMEHEAHIALSKHLSALRLSTVPNIRRPAGAHKRTSIMK